MAKRVAWSADGESRDRRSRWERDAAPATWSSCRRLEFLVQSRAAAEVAVSVSASSSPVGYQIYSPRTGEVVGRGSGRDLLGVDKIWGLIDWIRDLLRIWTVGSKRDQRRRTGLTKLPYQTSDTKCFPIINERKGIVPT